MARDAERETRLRAVCEVDAPFVAALSSPAAAKGDGSGSSAPPEAPTPPSLTPHLRLCVDLGYGEEIHGERGTRSLGQQLGWIWNAMKLAKSERGTPVLHLVSYEGKVGGCGCVCECMCVCGDGGYRTINHHAHAHTHSPTKTIDRCRARVHGHGEVAHPPARRRPVGCLS